MASRFIIVNYKLNDNSFVFRVDQKIINQRVGRHTGFAQGSFSFEKSILAFRWFDEEKNACSSYPPFEDPHKISRGHFEELAKKYRSI